MNNDEKRRNFLVFVTFNLLSNKLYSDSTKISVRFLLDLLVYTPWRDVQEDHKLSLNLKINQSQRGSLRGSRGSENSSLCFGRSTNKVGWWSQEAVHARSLSSLETWHSDLSHDFTHCQAWVISSQFTRHFMHGGTMYPEHEHVVKFEFYSLRLLMKISSVYFTMKSSQHLFLPEAQLGAVRVFMVWLCLNENQNPPQNKLNKPMIVQIVSKVVDK